MCQVLEVSVLADHRVKVSTIACEMSVSERSVIRILLNKLGMSKVRLIDWSSPMHLPVHSTVLESCSNRKRAYYNCDSSTIRVRFERDSSTIRARHATTRYEVFRALAYEIDSSTLRESVVGVSCMLIDSSVHTIFTFYLYRPTLHRVCEYARNCLYKRN